MLALTDEGLGYLVLAASRVSPRKRSRWLRELAEKLDPPVVRRPATVRQRKLRERRKNGVRVYRHELADRAVEGLIMKFILEGKLSEAQALDHRCIERAIAAFVEEEGFRFSR